MPAVSVPAHVCARHRARWHTHTGGCSWLHAWGWCRATTPAEQPGRLWALTSGLLGALGAWAEWHRGVPRSDRARRGELRPLRALSPLSCHLLGRKQSEQSVPEQPSATPGQRHRSRLQDRDCPGPSSRALADIRTPEDGAGVFSGRKSGRGPAASRRRGTRGDRGMCVFSPRLPLTP